MRFELNPDFIAVEFFENMKKAEIRICHQKNEYPTFIIRNIGHRVVSVNGLQLLMDDEVDLHHDRNGITIDPRVFSCYIHAFTNE